MIDKIKRDRRGKGKTTNNMETKGLEREKERGRKGERMKERES